MFLLKISRADTPAFEKMLLPTEKKPGIRIMSAYPSCLKRAREK